MINDIINSERPQKKILKHKKKIILLSVMATLCLLISSCAPKYFYYPDQVDYTHTPKKYRQAYEKITFNSKDGTQLEGWFIPTTLHKNPKDAIGTVIHFHGNAGNLTAHYPLISWLPEQGFNVFTFDYRGFGNSQGEPNFKGVFEDANAAINLVRANPKIDPSKLLVLSQSLGGNNAISALGSGNNQGIRAIVVDSTFYSYSAIANDKLWGVGALLNNQYAASRYVDKIAPIPILFLHGLDDEVIPYNHAEKLYAKANDPKKLILIPGKTHISALLDQTYQEEVTQFFKTALEKK